MTSAAARNSLTPETQRELEKTLEWPPGRVAAMQDPAIKIFLSVHLKGSVAANASPEDMAKAFCEQARAKPSAPKVVARECDFAAPFEDPLPPMKFYEP